MNTTAVTDSFAKLNQEIADANEAVKKSENALKSTIAFTTGFAVAVVPAFIIANRILTNRAKKNQND